MNKIVIYTVGPINTGWDWLPTLSQVSDKLLCNLKRSVANRNQNDCIAEIAHLVVMKRKLEQLLIIANKYAKFDGCFNREPRVFTFPVIAGKSARLKSAFIWSQKSKNLTFIASDHVLPLDLGDAIIELTGICYY